MLGLLVPSEIVEGIEDAPSGLVTQITFVCLPDRDIRRSIEIRIRLEFAGAVEGELWT
jgi:hypothetical protein